MHQQQQKNQFTLETLGAVNINLTASKTTLTNATGIKIACSIAGAGNGFINYNNSLGGTRTQIIELDAVGAAGVGNILPGSTSDVLTASGLIKLSSVAGNIGQTALPIELKAPSVSLNTDAGNSGAVVVANILGTANTTVLPSSADASFTLTGTAPLSLTNITVATGLPVGNASAAINISTTGKLLQTLPNSVIALGGGTTGTAASSGSISLSAASLKTGSIIFGVNSQVTTLVSSPGLGSGDINIFLGTTGASTNNPTPPTNVNPPVIVGGGQVTFGTNSIVANAPANNMSSVGGASIHFETNGQPANRILLNGGTTFVADPPVIAGASSAESSLTSQSVLTNTIALPAVVSPIITMVGGAQNTGMQQVTVGNTEGALAAPSVSLSSTSNNSNGLSAGFSNASLSSISGLAAALTTVQNVFNTSAGLQSAWLSQTELSDGQIPAAVISDDDLGVASEVSAVVEMERPSTHKTFEVSESSSRFSSVSRLGGYPLSGGVSKSIASSNNASEVRLVNLKRGSVVVAPTVDTLIDTPVGQIKLVAKSLALVMAFDGGLTVFNLDDTRKDSIQILAAGKTITLAPGQHLTLAPDAVQAFDYINPAQLIGHRNMNCQNIGYGLKAFSSEFSITHAIAAVQPLKHLIISKDPQAKKIAGHLLKTTSILMQLSGSGPRYTQMLRPAFQSIVCSSVP